MKLPSRQAARTASAARGAPREPLAGLLAVLREERPNADIPLVTRAYRVAERCHRGQRRRSGEPYITHPLAVATIVAETGADDPTVCAALLHDTVEDTPYPLARLRGEFGDEIAGLVAGVMALDALPADRFDFSDGDAGAMIAALGGERILSVKVADRLHNMRTLRFIPPEKQLLKSRQALEIFIPMARAVHGRDRLGTAQPGRHDAGAL